MKRTSILILLVACFLIARSGGDDRAAIAADLIAGVRAEWADWHNRPDREIPEEVMDPHFVYLVDGRSMNRKEYVASLKVHKIFRYELSTFSVAFTSIDRVLVRFHSLLILQVKKGQKPFLKNFLVEVTYERRDGTWVAVSNRSYQID